jgi:hypothetical protein
MKLLSSLILLVGTVATAPGQSNFRASLTSAGSENSWMPASAAFSLDGPAASFTISLGYELSGPAAPTTARLTGPVAELAFELRSPSIAIHFPLPWPPQPWPVDYGPSTSFSGSFLLPDDLRGDFVAGRTTLLLLGGQVNGFSGAVLPASPPRITGLHWEGASLEIHFVATPPYQYTIEYTEALELANWSSLGTVGAASQSFEAVVTDSVPSGAARFYRIRRELCCH